MNWSELVGMKIVAFRGIPKKQYTFKNAPPQPVVVPMSMILFDDKKTFLEFSEQDHYDYHDCNDSARTLHLWQDEARWQRMFDKEGFEEPTNLAYPF